MQPVITPRVQEAIDAMGALSHDARNEVVDGIARVTITRTDNLGVVVPVMISKNYKAWPKHDKGGKTIYVPSAEALTKRYRFDQHMAAYSVPSVPRRLETRAAERLRVEMRMAIFDIDGPGHKATDEWWESEKVKLAELQIFHPGAFVSRTRGGYKIFFLLQRPIYIADAGTTWSSDRKSWQRLYCSWVAYLARVFGIEADAACKDWTRLYRVPRATRDEGGNPEDLETIGDPQRLGIWLCDLTAADMDAGAKLASKRVEEDDDAPRTPRTSTYKGGRGRLVDAFDKRGMLGDELETNEKWLVECPFSASHTTGEDYDGSAVVWAADRSRGDLGHFHCSHSHCADRSLKEVIAIFSDEEMGNQRVSNETETTTSTATADTAAPRRQSREEISAERERTATTESSGVTTTATYGPIPTQHEIKIRTAEHEVVAETIEALRLDPRLFQQGGRPVQVVRVPMQINGRLKQAEVPQIVGVTSANLRTRMTACARFVIERKDKKTGENETIVTHPPKWLPDAVLSAGEWPGIRVLDGVTEAPTLRPDGTILDKPGYDAGTRLLYVPTDTFVTIPEHPTIEDARRACAELCDIVSDFPIDRINRAAWIGATLTPFARPAIAGPVPLFAVDKNVRGAGAGLLADVSAIIATGRPAPVEMLPATDEEMGKVITSLVMAGVRIALFDNVTTTLGGAALDAALTGRTHRGRILGRSEMTGELPINIIFWATANNLVIGGDTIRRICRIRLESLEERPEERQNFTRPDLRAYVRAERGRFVAAALTILRAYCAAGRPDMNLKPWGSYEAWSEIIRGAVVWIGEPDPAAHRAELASQDDGEAAALAALLDGLELAGATGAGLTTAKILERAGTNSTDYDGLREAIAEIAPTRDGKLPTPKSLGRRLLHLRKRVSGGRFLERKETTSKAVSWVVEKVKA